MSDKGKPEAGKQYALTGKKGDPCIANGNTWAESEVKPADEIQSWAVKAFREDGTPTANPRRYFVLRERAVALAKDIAEAMTGGWAQLEWLNPRTGYWEFVEIFESARKPKNPQQAADDNRAARSMK